MFKFRGPRKVHDVLAEVRDRLLSLEVNTRAAFRRFDELRADTHHIEQLANAARARADEVGALLVQTIEPLMKRVERLECEALLGLDDPEPDGVVATPAELAWHRIEYSNFGRKPCGPYPARGVPVLIRYEYDYYGRAQPIRIVDSRWDGSAWIKADGAAYSRRARVTHWAYFNKPEGAR